MIGYYVIMALAAIVVLIICLASDYNQKNISQICCVSTSEVAAWKKEERFPEKYRWFWLLVDISENAGNMYGHRILHTSSDDEAEKIIDLVVENKNIKGKEKILVLIGNYEKIMSNYQEFKNIYENNREKISITFCTCNAMFCTVGFCQRYYQPYGKGVFQDIPYECK